MTFEEWFGSKFPNCGTEDWAHHYRECWTAALASSPSQPADAALDALRDILAMIDEGYLVRNTSDDGEPGFAMRQLPYVARLAKAARAAAPALVAGKK